MVLFHFLFEWLTEKIRLFFSRVRIKFIASHASKWNKKYIVFILLHFFLFCFKYFSFHFASNFTLNFAFCFVPDAVSVHDVLVVFEMLLSTLCFRCSEVPGSLLFREANLWKMTSSYCPNCNLYYTDFNRNRSTDLTKEGSPPMLVQKEKWIKSKHIFLYSSELEFLKSLWALGTEEEEGYRTGPSGYIGWRNSFLGIDSGAQYTFKNTGSFNEILVKLA
jgi:hypothetical protein